MEIVTEPTVSASIENTQNLDGSWNRSADELNSEYLQSFVSGRLSSTALQDVVL